MTDAQRTVAVQVAIGALAAYVTHPLVWLVGPLRWVAFVVATARQEGNLQADVAVAETNGTTSWGTLQYNDVRLAEIGGLDVARSPVRAAYATGGYVTARILDYPALFVLLAIPGLGWAWFRRTWTQPSSAASWASPAVQVDVVREAFAEHARPGLELVVKLRALTIAAELVVGAIVRWGRA